ncbi:MAG TPA: hypothetical protein VHC46_05930 [Thermodesulfobacteriota bacterium]|nr:hypothetical protein [Thermodesulfobacteriota bacterium]
MKMDARAFPASSFLDSVGINTHLTYTDTPYVREFDCLLEFLRESGIRHVRDRLSDRIAELGGHGISSTVIADLDGNSNGGRGTVRRIVGKIKAINAAGRYIVAVEGPNEPDNSWPKHRKVYKGFGFLHGKRGFLAGAVEFQKDLYKALKSDPETSALPVIGLSICPVHDPLGLSPNPLGESELSPYADWGNIHSFPGNNPYNVPFPYAGLERYYWQSNFPSINLDEYPWALELYGRPHAPKPMAATEAGYATHIKGVSETVQAKYIPRLCCEHFRLGFKRTFIYELADEFDDGDVEAHYGLLRLDLTPKPAYTALKGLLRLLKDEGKTTTTRCPDYQLTVTGPEGYYRTDFLHHLILQKSDGDLYFLLWHEISCEDVSVTPHRELSHPDMNVMLSLEVAIKRAVLYRYDSSWDLRPEELPVRGGGLEFGVPDSVVVLELSLGS